MTLEIDEKLIEKLTLGLDCGMWNLANFHQSP